jgi:hypothetical protein
VSHFTRVKTEFKNKDAILKSLEALGYHHVEVHSTAQNLYGYKGDMREQTAEIIIRRKYIGSASNDVGFKLMPDGTWEAIISEYDSRTRWNQKTMMLFKQGYSEEILRQKLMSKPSVRRKLKNMNVETLPNQKRRVRAELK